MGIYEIDRYLQASCYHAGCLATIESMKRSQASPSWISSQQAPTTKATEQHWSTSRGADLQKGKETAGDHGFGGSSCADNMGALMSGLKSGSGLDSYQMGILPMYWFCAGRGQASRFVDCVAMSRYGQTRTGVEWLLRSMISRTPTCS